jgi:hypothetical protein
MFPTDWTGNGTWAPMAAMHYAAMTAALRRLDGGPG